MKQGFAATVLAKTVRHTSNGFGEHRSRYLLRREPGKLWTYMISFFKPGKFTELINGFSPELQHCGKDVSKFSPLPRKPSLAVAMHTGKYNLQ